MPARIPQDYVMLSKVEAAIAVECIKIAIRYCPDARASGLLAALRDVTAASGSPQAETAAHSLSGDGTTVTSRVAAELIGCNPRRILQLREDGELDGEKVGRDWQIELASVHALLEQRRISA